MLECLLVLLDLFVQLGSVDFEQRNVLIDVGLHPPSVAVKKAQEPLLDQGEAGGRAGEPPAQVVDLRGLDDFPAEAAEEAVAADQARRAFRAVLADHGLQP